MCPVVETQNLAREYVAGPNRLNALHGLSLRINAGEYVAIMGASGSGKSTLLNLLGLLDRPSFGTYLLDGEDTSKFTPNRRSDLRSQKIGFVFQRFNLLSRCRTLENVELPLIYAGVGAKERQRRIRDALDITGLSHRAKHWPSQLSGGEQQRVAIARAIVNRPSLILADEPTGSLDSRTGQTILDLFGSLNREGRTIITVTHDATVARHAARVIHLRDGVLISDDRSDPRPEHPDTVRSCKLDMVSAEP